MQTPNRTFETRGPVSPDRNYVVPRTAEIADLIERIKKGRYIAISAPRQTGKTTFFRWALDALTAEDTTYFPIQLDFETYRNVSVESFYTNLRRDIRDEVVREPRRFGVNLTSNLQQFLENYPLRDHNSFQSFLRELATHLGNRRVAVIIDEFDGIPRVALSDFLYTLRRIYLSRDANRCPHSVGIVGVKNIRQLNYDRSISPFNIQDEFVLSNFTLDQVETLLGQYTEEVGQAFAQEVVESIHKQTAGQPFLVNRMSQILAEEMDVPLSETIRCEHFEIAYKKILNESNVHISHLTTNIRREPQFERVLMRVILNEQKLPFSIDDPSMSELFTYGVMLPDEDGNCKIQNPIYQYRIVRAFQPLFNGLEMQYLPEDTDAGFLDYMTSDGKIDMRLLLSNFRDFIARAGYRILEVPETPKEFVGQYLLFAYLDSFVQQIRGFMYLEVRTGRGQMDLIILHSGEKYIVETKIWGGESLYHTGKGQLAAYLKSEGVQEGYYIVFDHRQNSRARVEEESIDGKIIVSYCIPAVQNRPSDET